MKMEQSSARRIKFKDYFLFNIMIGMFIIISSLILYIIDVQFENKLLIFSWIGNLILIWAISAFKKIKYTHINPYTFFFLSYFFFSYGQIFLYSIGIDYDRFNLIHIFSNEEIINYCLYFSIGTCFFLFGAIIAIRKDLIVERRIDSFQEHNDLALNKSVKSVAWIMLLISAPIYLKDFISNLSNSINYGYRAIYDMSESSMISNVVESFSMWFIPSMFMLLVVYKKRKYFKWGILLVLILISAGIFAIGSRSRAMAIIISLLYLWNIEIRKFQKFDKVLLGSTLIAVFALLPVIQMFRGFHEKSIGKFSEVLYSMQANNNLIVSIIGELGGSMQPWLLVNRLIPDIYSFKLGQSYVASLFAIIPSVLLGGFSTTRYAHLSGWLQNAANMSYGPGFSILAEAYYNFGWFGVPILSVIGWIYFKFLSNNMFRGSIINFKNLFSAIALFAFITSARGSMYLTIRTEFYVIFIPIILIKLIYGQKKRGQTLKERM